MSIRTTPKFGSRVVNGKVTVNVQYDFIKIESSFTHSTAGALNADNYLSEFVGTTITGATTGVTATVIEVIAASGSDPATLYLKYTNSGTNNIKIYINGTLDGQGTFSGISWASGAEGDQVKIGNGNSANTDAYFQGYIQDFRITVGSANYTSNFTPTTAPLSSSGAALHIKGTDASIIDKSQGANLELVNTTGSTTQVKFANTKSIYTGGNSSATIRLDASNKFYDLSYGEGDFTVEGWFYTTDNTNNPKLYIDISGASAYWQLYYISGSGITLRANNTGIYSIETGNSFTENTWHHIALCRSGSNYKVFHNGTEIINVNSTHQIGSNSTKTIGGTDISTGNNLRGYIQDFRITKGLARYTASFTPPTEPLKG